jgi:hypothetical protein
MRFLAVTRFFVGVKRAEALGALEVAYRHNSRLSPALCAGE